MRFHPFSRAARHAQHSGAPSERHPGLQTRQLPSPPHRAAAPTTPPRRRTHGITSPLVSPTSRLATAAHLYGHTIVRALPQARPWHTTPTLASLPVEVLTQVASHLEGCDLDDLCTALTPLYGSGIRAALTPAVGAAFMDALQRYVGQTHLNFIDVAQNGLPKEVLARLNVAQHQRLTHLARPLGLELRLPRQLRGHDHAAFAQRFEQLAETYQVFLHPEPREDRHLRLSSPNLPLALEAFAELCLCPPIATRLQMRALPDLRHLVAERDECLVQCAAQATELKDRIGRATDIRSARRALCYIEPLTDAVRAAFAAMNNMHWLVHRA